MPHTSNLLIIGAGHLGERVGRRWGAEHPSAEVTAETRSLERHAALHAAQMNPRQRCDPGPDPHPYVLLAIPPSSQEDYPAEAARAARLCNGRGMLLMVSSTAVYAEAAGGRCTESSPLGDSPRARRLLDAEKRVLEAGGAVVRLAGLYDHDRGPQRVFLRMETSPRRPDGLLNLIHYEDAATLCTAALQGGRAGRVYVGCDGAPISRQELVDATARSHRYGSGGHRCRFVGTEGPLGRRCDNEATRRELGWQPRVPSFVSWVQGDDERRLEPAREVTNS